MVTHSTTEKEPNKKKFAPTMRAFSTFRTMHTYKHILYAKQ